MARDERPDLPTLRITTDYPAMIDLARRSGLESSSLAGTIVAYGFYDSDNLVGCVCLRQVPGAFTVECLAVEERMRGRGLGTSLVRKIEEEATARGVKKLWAVARQPAFFERLGYRRKRADEDDGPDMGDCERCVQYLKVCNPAIVVKDL